MKGTPTGVVFGYDDPVSSAKVVFEYMQECKHLRVKGGVLDGKAISPVEAESLSKMPSRSELQAQIVQLALSPGRKIAGQLAAPASRIVGAIDALVKRLEV
jgi:large subunit ribosomal protein L10